MCRTRRAGRCARAGGRLERPHGKGCRRRGTAALSTPPASLDRSRLRVRGPDLTRPWRSGGIGAMAAAGIRTVGCPGMAPKLRRDRERALSRLRARSEIPRLIAKRDGRDDRVRGGIDHGNGIPVHRTRAARDRSRRIRSDRPGDIRLCPMTGGMICLREEQRPGGANSRDRGSIQPSDHLFSRARENIGGQIIPVMRSAPAERSAGQLRRRPRCPSA